MGFFDWLDTGYWDKNDPRIDHNPYKQPDPTDNQAVLDHIARDDGFRNNDERDAFYSDE